mmetsp:Transcript_19485/g.36420  ORF Transcript_19485/g.36420 Transcript_19485/m.36420 type:complete len:232 (-) Transcript_19485:1293-1988(-)
MKSLSFILRSARMLSLCKSVLSMIMLNESKYAASLAFFSSVENTFNPVDSTHCRDMLSANACSIRSIICASPGNRNVAKNIRNPSRTVRFWNANEEQKDSRSALWNQSRSNAGVLLLESFSDFPNSPRYWPTAGLSNPTTSPFRRKEATLSGVDGEGSMPLSIRYCRPFLGFSLNNAAAWWRLRFLFLAVRRCDVCARLSLAAWEGSPSDSAPWNNRRKLPSNASKHSSFR